MTPKLAVAAAVLGAGLLLASAPANARGWHHGWHHGGWGYGAAGFAAGALIGSAIAAPPYYYGYGPPAYAYEPAPGYPGDAEAYCESRFRSYDPSSGTYMGYDGRRHPCP